MAKKTKTTKKKLAQKASKNEPVRSSKKTADRKGRPTATAKGRTSSAATPKETAAKPASVKKVVEKPIAENATTTKAAAATGTTVKESASKNAVVKRRAFPKPAATAVAMHQCSSVIRIKTNAKSNRKGRGKSADSVNHRATTGPAPGATSQDPIQFPEETRPLPKTHLSAKELREFKLLLSAKRTELCGDVERLTAEAFHHVEEGGNERSAMPIHMADLGSDNWEQDFTLGLIDTERLLVTEIDEALKRIDEKTFGICVATHNKISLARLRAKPWAKYCIEYARAREEGRAY